MFETNVTPIIVLYIRTPDVLQLATQSGIEPSFFKSKFQTQIFFKVRKTKDGLAEIFRLSKIDKNGTIELLNSDKYKKE